MLGRALALLLGLFLTTNAQAEAFVMPTMQTCQMDNPGSTFAIAQEQYGEQPFLQGMTFVTTIQGQFLMAEMYLLLNPETKTFSLILRDPNTDVECLWLAGGEIVPMIQGDPL
jgi:hypothetical protein